MHDTRCDDLQRRLAAANGFLLDALDANRAGRLSQEQVALLQQDAAQTRRIVVLVGVVVAAISGGMAIVPIAQRGLVTGIQNGQLGILVFTGVGVLLVWVGGRWQPYRGDIAEGHVAQHTGVGTRVRAYTEGDTSWYCTVGTAGNLKQFEVTETGFRAWVDGLVYRAYYLPESGKLLNLEVLRPATGDGAER